GSQWRPDDAWRLHRAAVQLDPVFGSHQAPDSCQLVGGMCQQIVLTIRSQWIIIKHYSIITNGREINNHGGTVMIYRDISVKFYVKAKWWRHHLAAVLLIRRIIISSH